MLTMVAVWLENCTSISLVYQEALRWSTATVSHVRVML